MKISNYLKTELEQISSGANFTDDEAAVFNYMAKDITADLIASKLNVSERTVYRIRRRVKDKIKRIQINGNILAT